MTRFSWFGAWCCLLIWGGVHALQWEHALVHHWAPDSAHAHCAHHLQEEGADVEQFGNPDLPGVRPNDECALCDWTAVPGMAPDPDVFRIPGEFPWCPVGLGKPALGWQTPAHVAGMGRRGPPSVELS